MRLLELRLNVWNGTARGGAETVLFFFLTLEIKIQAAEVHLVNDADRSYLMVSTRVRSARGRGLARPQPLYNGRQT
jgi:hypothetical protein